MPHIVVPLTALPINTYSANLVAAGAAVAAADTFEIDVRNRTDDLILVIGATGAGASAVTINAGVDPPSKREGMGNLSPVTLNTTETRLLSLEGGRFIQGNGKITGAVATNGVRIWAYRTSRRS